MSVRDFGTARRWRIYKALTWAVLPPSYLGLRGEKALFFRDFTAAHAYYLSRVTV